MASRGEMFPRSPPSWVHGMVPLVFSSWQKEQEPLEKRLARDRLEPASTSCRSLMSSNIDRYLSSSVSDTWSGVIFHNQWLFPRDTQRGGSKLAIQREKKYTDPRMTEGSTFQRRKMRRKMYKAEVRK